jgi:hypothetical protein
MRLAATLVASGAESETQQNAAKQGLRIHLTAAFSADYLDFCASAEL